jgi:hypothetical protein
MWSKAPRGWVLHRGHRLGVRGCTVQLGRGHVASTSLCRVVGAASREGFRVGARLEVSALSGWVFPRISPEALSDPLQAGLRFLLAPVPPGGGPGLAVRQVCSHVVRGRRRPMGLTEFRRCEIRGGSGTHLCHGRQTLSFGALGTSWEPWPALVLIGWCLAALSRARPVTCTRSTNDVALRRWFTWRCPFSTTPSRYTVTRDWVGAVGCTCDVSCGFAPQDYSPGLLPTHAQDGVGPEGWPGRMAYRRS